MKWNFFLLLCLCSAFTAAQVQIQGKVVDNKGNGIFAANVYLQTQPETGTSTNFEGNFSFSVEKTQDLLVISFIGYETKTLQLSKLLLTKELIITLKEDSQMLSEIIIRAQDPISEKFSVTKIKKLDIYFNPVAQADPLKAITILPASTTTDETANPSLRGSSPDRTRVMLNGVPIYTPVRSSQLNNQGFFSLFSTEIIDKQYVYASNPPLTYGNTSAGLVEIQTLKNLSHNQRQLSLSIGAAGFFLSQQLKKNEENFFQLYGNYQFSDAFIGMQEKYLPQLKAFSTKDIGLNFHHQLSKNIDFNSFNYAVDEDYLVFVNILNYSGEANASKKRFFSVNTWNYYTKKGILSLNTGFSTSKQQLDYGNINSNKNVEQIYASLSFKSQIAKNLNIQTGISYDYHKNHFNDSIPKYYYAITPEAPQEITNDRITNHIAETYLYSNWEISPRISFSAGIRSNIPSQDQSHYLNAQAGIKYKINSKHSLLFSGGRYHSYGTPNYYNKAFTLLSSQQYACDYNYSSKNFGAKAALYYKTEKGQQALNSYITIDKLETLGLEAYVEYSFAKHFKLSASNLFIDQKQHQDDTKFHGKYDFSYLAKIALQYKHLKWFSVSISYISRPGSYYTPIKGVIDKRPYFEYLIPLFGRKNSAQYKAYNKIDLGINRYIPLKKGGAIIPFLSISNVFNFKNQSEVYYDEDFSKKFFENYSKRVVYFGIIWEL